MTGVNWQTSLDPAAASRDLAAEKELLDDLLRKLTRRRLSRLSLSTRAELSNLLTMAVVDLEEEK
ncbi:hypothetical protein ACXYTP_05130 [Tsukamurella ocularis]|uniref:hypothetical protein n=1 Tax=Tsukamurella ocularis TaxID=1970234 RepID=UPI0039EFF245